MYSFYGQGTVSDTAVTLNQIDIDISKTSEVYVSKRGKRYYPWWCDSGMKSIKKENIVWYDSAKDAEGDGYTISASCRK